jgi:hypothetical protein
MKKHFTILIFLIASCTISSGQNTPNYLPTNGLVGWWPFNSNANDESGSGNSGTVNGATLTTDRFGNTNKAYSFDGINDEINYQSGINSSLNIIGDISISFFMRTIQNNTGIILSFGEHNSEQGGYLAALNISNINQDGPFGYHSTGPWVFSNDSINDNYWHSIIVVHKSDTVSIFVDGVLESQSTNISQITSWNGERKLGVRNDISMEYFNGEMDDLGIWNRALTQQEITNLYNGNVCYQTITVTDTLIINTGIITYNPVTFNNTIKIFPNPTNDHITIDYGNFATMNGYHLKIENSLGQELFQTIISQQTDYLSLNNWGGNGLYFVHIVDPQGNTIDIRKIVLQ